MTRTQTLISTTGHELARFWTDEGGATAIEYALIASGVGAFIAATVYNLGSGVKSLFNKVSSAFPG